MSLTAAVTTESADEIIVVTLGGLLSMETVALVRRTLMKCLAEAPEAVIVDIGALSVDRRSRLTVFLGAARAYASAGTTLMLCGASAELTTLMGGRVLGEVPAFPTYAHALAAVSDATRRPHKVSVRLAATPAAPRSARETVAHACRSWNVDHLEGPATLVISELVSNAVQHAHTDVHVTIALRGDYLHLSVRDNSPHIPVVRHCEPADRRSLSERGRGLHLVAAYTTAWDVRANSATKTVWATIRATPQTPRGGQPG